MRARLGVLAERDFRLLWSGQAISAVGDQMVPIAVAVAVLERGGGPAEVGIVFAARIVALVVFLGLGGVWADRVSARSVMLAADAVRLAAVLGLVALPTGTGIGGLTALVFAVGAGEAFFRPAYSALVPQLLSPDQLPAGNALSALSLDSARVAGPALAGLLAAAGGPRLVFAIDAGTFAVGLLTLLAVRRRENLRQDRRSALREAAEGVAAVRERPWVAAVLAMASVQLMLAVAPAQVLLPVIARESLGGDRAYGLVAASLAVGGLVGAVLSGRWRPARPGTVGLVGVMLFALVPAALATPRSLWWVIAAYAVGGVALTPFNVWWETALQREIPRRLLARVSSLDYLCSFALLPVGLVLTGPAVELVGRNTVLAVAAAAVIVPNLLVLRVPGAREFRTPPAAVS